MGASFTTILSAFEKHFNDILGVLAPGLLLLAGLQYTGLIGYLDIPALDLKNIGHLFALILASILAGHLADQLGIFIEAMSNRYFGNKNRELGVADEAQKDVIQDDNIISHKTDDPHFAFQVFEDWIQNKTGNMAPRTVSDLRSIAMSLSKKGEFLSRKFKFIELFCRGSGASLIIISIIALIVIIHQLATIQPMSLKLISIIMITLFVAPLLFYRSKKFSDFSDSVPFSCAVAEILAERISGEHINVVKQPTNIPDLKNEVKGRKNDQT